MLSTDQIASFAFDSDLMPSTLVDVSLDEIFSCRNISQLSTDKGAFEDTFLCFDYDQQCIEIEGATSITEQLAHLTDPMFERFVLHPIFCFMWRCFLQTSDVSSIYCESQKTYLKLNALQRETSCKPFSFFGLSTLLTVLVTCGVFILLSVLFVLCGYKFATCGYENRIKKELDKILSKGQTLVVKSHFNEAYDGTTTEVAEMGASFTTLTTKVFTRSGSADEATGNCDQVLESIVNKEVGRNRGAVERRVSSKLTRGNEYVDTATLYDLAGGLSHVSTYDSKYLINTNDVTCTYTKNNNGTGLSGYEPDLATSSQSEGTNSNLEETTFESCVETTNTEDVFFI